MGRGGVGCIAGGIALIAVGIAFAVPLLRQRTVFLEPAPPGTPPPSWEEGVALAIVMDTSGSMAEPVSTGAGGRDSKYLVANRALAAIADRIEAWRKAAPAGTARRVDATLVTFRDSAEIPMGPFDPAALKAWAGSFRSPGGSTPLGNAVRTASDAVLRSRLGSKHVLVVTDGQNTEGPEPAEAMDAVVPVASSLGTGVSVHFVAFDVDADVFRAVKAKGATVVGASDARQLGERLKSILEEEILLEAPGPGPGGR